MVKESLFAGNLFLVCGSVWRLQRKQQEPRVAVKVALPEPVEQRCPERVARSTAEAEKRLSYCRGMRRGSLSINGQRLGKVFCSFSDRGAAVPKIGHLL